MFKVEFIENPFRKHEIVNSFCNDSCIVTNVDGNTITLRMYKVPKNRVARFVKFQWTKFMIFLRIY